MKIKIEFVIIFLLGLIFIGLLFLNTESSQIIIVGPRFILGLIFILFVPGYALQAALFPSDTELNGLQRVAIAFGLSVALIPPIALILDNLSEGIRPWPIVLSLAIVISLFMAIAIYRQRKFLPEQSSNVIPGPWWQELDLASTMFYGLSICALIGAAISTYAIIVIPDSSDYFTEFYIVGEENMAGNYLPGMTANQSITVTLGIVNHEGGEARYTVLIKTGDDIIGQSPIISLKNGETWQRPIGFRAPAAGDQDIEFVLNRDGYAEPYRTLQLKINVKPKPTP
jgi:uncharacterized membrane protein